jgi:hypothetical protein
MTTSWVKVLEADGMAANQERKGMEPMTQNKSVVNSGTGEGETSGRD